MRYIALIISVALTVSAQTLWKIGGTSLVNKTQGILGTAFSYIMSPLILLGFVLSGVAALLWTYALSELDFNYVSFISSLSYIFVILVSFFIFKETIPPMRWVGCAFIMVGIIFVLRS